MEYIIHLLVLISIWSILGISLNLVIGYTGLLSITHATFFGVGAYATAILMTGYGWNFFLAMLVGAIIAMAVSFVLGSILGKFKGDYYALASFGFNIIAFSIMLNWQSLTRGPLGIPGIGRPQIFDFVFRSNSHFLILAAALTLLTYLLSQYIVGSSFGRVIKAIREDEQAISVFGYNTKIYKMIIFVVAAGLAAVAGALFASYITFIDPSSFSLNESIFILSIVILGGLASNKGVFWGTVFLILLPEALRFVGFPTDVAAQMRQVVYGLLLLFLMMYRPQGFMGEYKL
ncbi:MAG: branched-chain amino acid ABC transporter permease [bacterium]